MFWDNFERQCRLAGISPSAATEAIGKSKTTAANWKMNKSTPKQDDLYKLANVLGCSPADFFIDSEDEKVKNAVNTIRHFLVTFPENDSDFDKAVTYKLQIAEDIDNILERYTDLFYENDSRSKLIDSDQNFEKIESIYDSCSAIQKMELVIVVMKFAEDNGINIDDL